MEPKLDKKFTPVMGALALWSAEYVDVAVAPPVTASTSDSDKVRVCEIAAGLLLGAFIVSSWFGQSTVLHRIDE